MGAPDCEREVTPRRQRQVGGSKKGGGGRRLGKAGNGGWEKVIQKRTESKRMRPREGSSWKLFLNPGGGSLAERGGVVRKADMSAWRKGGAGGVNEGAKENGTNEEPKGIQKNPRDFTLDF